jgi:tetratricopeptide (TPR) repeat protein
MKKNDEALVLLQRLQDNFPRAVRPKQLYALALARIGAASDDKKQKEEYLKQAQHILGLLYESGEQDPETLGIYGRTWMDRFNLTDCRNMTYLEQSRRYYAEAFKKAPDDYYTGVNAAAKSVLLGTPEDLAKGLDFAKQTQAVVGAEPWPNDYWKTATVAEVLLIEKEYKKAGEMYAEAIRMEPGSTASHESTRGQAVKLLEKLGATEEERQQVLAAFA